MIPIDIQVIDPKELLEFRQKVLLPHKKATECFIEGDEKSNSIHLAAIIDGKIAGCASFVEEAHNDIESKTQYRLRQMGVEPQYQSFGIGRDILNEGLSRLTSQGVFTVWCHARKVAYPFYLKLGFKYISSEFEIPIIGLHRTMVYEMDQP